MIRIIILLRIIRDIITGKPEDEPVGLILIRNLDTQGNSACQNAARHLFNRLIHIYADRSVFTGCRNIYIQASHFLISALKYQFLSKIHNRC